MAELTDQDRQILDFERQWWKYTGAKEQAIRDTFNLAPVTYYGILDTLLDSPDALAYAPPLVKRLRRLRDERRAARAHRRRG